MTAAPRRRAGLFFYFPSFEWDPAPFASALHRLGDARAVRLRDPGAVYRSVRVRWRLVRRRTFFLLCEGGVSDYVYISVGCLPQFAPSPGESSGRCVHTLRPNPLTCETHPFPGCLLPCFASTVAAMLGTRRGAQRVSRPVYKRGRHSGPHNGRDEDSRSRACLWYCGPPRRVRTVDVALLAIKVAAAAETASRAGVVVGEPRSVQPGKGHHPPTR